MGTCYYMTNHFAFGRACIIRNTGTLPNRGPPSFLDVKQSSEIMRRLDSSMLN